MKAISGGDFGEKEAGGTGPGVEERLNHLLTAAGMEPLLPEQSQVFSAYLSLILRWNARTNLTAVRDDDGILSRHFIESIACARVVPSTIGTLLDFGSGAGFPGLPIALCRPGISVTLAESQGKKAAFLREVVRVLGVPVTVHSGRAETMTSRFDCVALRAVDRMKEAVESAATLLTPSGWLALITTAGEAEKLQAAAGADFVWNDAVPLPGGERRLIVLGRR